jgi:hypothetical protein
MIRQVFYVNLHVLYFQERTCNNSNERRLISFLQIFVPTLFRPVPKRNRDHQQKEHNQHLSRYFHLQS